MINETIENMINEQAPGVESILSAIEDNMYFDNLSCIYFSGHLVQKNFLNKLKNESADNGEKVLRDLHGILETILRPQNSFLHIAANAKKLIKHFGSDLLIFNSVFNESSTAYNENQRKRFQLKQPHEYRRKHFDSHRHVGLGLESIKSCYLSQSILYNNTDWGLKSVPDIVTLTRYMKIIWDIEMRPKDDLKATGHSSRFELNPSLSTGRIILKLNNVANLTTSYKKVKRVFRDYLQGKKPWNETLVDSAKGLLIYEWTEKEDSMRGLVNTADESYFRNVDAKYNRMFIKSLARVKSESLKSVANQILTPFLDSDSTQTIVVCNKKKMSQVAMDFAKLGFHIKVYQSFKDTAL